MLGLAAHGQESTLCPGGCRGKLVGRLAAKFARRVMIGYDLGRVASTVQRPYFASTLKGLRS